MDYQEQEKSHRLRTIIITVIIIALVVIIGVWLVFAAINSSHRHDIEVDRPSTESSISQSADHPAVAEPSSTSTSSPAAESSSTSPADQYNNKPASNSAVSAPAPASDDIPSTGPEDFVFSALLIGVAVYLVGLNLQLAKPRHRVV